MLKQSIADFIVFNEKKHLFEIDVFDLEKITKIAYGSKIEMVLFQKNTSMQIYVNGEISEENKIEISDALINETLEKQKYHIVLNDLANKGIISKGLYLIHAYW